MNAYTMMRTIALILMGYAAADMVVELIGLIQAYREKKRKEEEQEHQWYVERCINIADRLTAEYIRIENLTARTIHAENLIAKNVVRTEKLETLLAAELDKENKE